MLWNGAISFKQLIWSSMTGDRELQIMNYRSRVGELEVNFYPSYSSIGGMYHGKDSLTRKTDILLASVTYR